MKKTEYDFKIEIDKSGNYDTYTYCNLYNPDEQYIVIYADCTKLLHSLVTFKPANIDGAPVMVVDTYKEKARIYLPRIVDEWEIKYYSNSESFSHPDDKYLKNSGVVNLYKEFGDHILDGLILELHVGQFISPLSKHCALVYNIPEVNTPAAAVFNVVSGEKEGKVNTYTYRNMNNPDETYFEIYTMGTHYLYSVVTFKPANIPDAPVMKVYTDNRVYIFLPRSVDEWEIKYYSNTTPSTLNDKCLKCAGVVDLNEFFGEFIETGLYLELSMDQCIHPPNYSDILCYYIPSVD